MYKGVKGQNITNQVGIYATNFYTFMISFFYEKFEKYSFIHFNIESASTTYIKCKQTIQR